MEEETVVAKGDGWLMMLNKEGEYRTILCADTEVVRKPLTKHVLKLLKVRMPELSGLRRQLGFVSLIAIGSMATGCMTEHVLTHYQFEKMIESAIKINPEMDDFNGE